MKLYFHSAFGEDELPSVTEKFLKALENSPLPFEIGVAIKCLIASWRNLTDQIKELESHLIDEAHCDAKNQRLSRIRSWNRSA